MAFEIKGDFLADLTDSGLLLMSQAGLVFFVIWLIATASGKDNPKPKNRTGQGGKWSQETNPQPYNEKAWQTAVQMAVSS